MNLARIRRRRAALGSALLAVVLVLLGAGAASADGCGCPVGGPSVDAPTTTVSDPAPVSDIGTPPTSQATAVHSRPWVAGRTRVGHRLHVRVGRLDAGTTTSYQWYRRLGDGRAVAVRHATHRSYRVRGADVGHRVAVEVTYHGATTAPTTVWSRERRVR